MPEMTDEERREKNEEVAEKVLGWHKHYPGLSYDGCNHWWLAPESRDEHDLRLLPDFYGDWNHMALVVEAMRQGYDLRLYSYPDGRWLVVFDNSERKGVRPGRRVFEAQFGPTVPQAICDAALKAKAALAGKEGKA